MVKLQVLNLAVKLYLTNSQQTETLCRYLFSLARYDENYDIRDRARFLKPFIFPSNGETILSKQAKRVFLSAKPAPLLVSQYCREQFQLGSLAHYLNARTTGYHDLPAFPKKAPDSSVRNVETAGNEHNNFEQNDQSEYENRSAKGPIKTGKKEKFYSDSENENDSSDESGSENSSDEDSNSDDSSGNESGSGAKSNNSDDDSEEDSSDSSSEESSSASSDSDESSSSSEKNQLTQKPNVNSKVTASSIKAERSNLDLLLDLGDIAPAAPIMTPSLGGFLTPLSNTAGIGTTSGTSSRFELVGPVHVSLDKRELLNKINSYGLQITYRFTRAPHLYSAKMVSIELTFRNESNSDLENINLSNKSALPANVSVCDFAPIAKIMPGQCVQGIVGVDFNDSTQPIAFEVQSSAGNAKVSLKTTVGELIRAVRMTEATFKEEQIRLRGMNEHSCKLDTSATTASIQHSIFEVANLALIANNNNSDGDMLLFSGQTMSSQSLVLVTVERIQDNGITITVNCEKMVIGSMLLNEIKNSIK